MENRIEKWILLWALALGLISSTSNDSWAEVNDGHNAANSRTTCSCCEVLVGPKELSDLRDLAVTSQTTLVELSDFLSAVKRTDGAIRKHNRPKVFLQPWIDDSYSTSRDRQLELLSPIIESYVKSEHTPDLSTDDVSSLAEFMVWPKGEMNITYSEIFELVLRKKISRLVKRPLSKQGFKDLFLDVIRANAAERRWNKRNRWFLSFAGNNRAVYWDLIKTLEILNQFDAFKSISSFSFPFDAIQELEEELSRLTNLLNPFEYDSKTDIRPNDWCVKYAVKRAELEGVENVSLDDYKLLYRMNASPRSHRSFFVNGQGSEFGMNWLNQKSDEDLLEIFSINPGIARVYLVYTLKTTTFDFMKKIESAVRSKTNNEEYISELWQIYYRKAPLIGVNPAYDVELGKSISH